MDEFLRGCLNDSLDENNEEEKNSIISNETNRNRDMVLTFDKKNIIETSENSEYDTDIKIIQENSGSLIIILLYNI